MVQVLSTVKAVTCVIKTSCSIKMGSDQSHPQQPQGPSGSLTTGDLSLFSSTLRGVSANASEMLSPRQESVCSDSEVPYVSYTVNKPIGESPKKGKPSKYRFASPRLSKRSISTTDNTSHEDSSQSHIARRFGGGDSTMVVVSKKSSKPSIESDPDLIRLKDIPSFLPIMRASLSGGGSIVKDPEILERLDNRGLMAMCQRYQSHLRATVSVVSTQQAEICKTIRDVDERLSKVSQVLIDRQKQYAKYSEQLKKVSEMSRILNKCHLLLNENLEQLDVLNNMLPCEHRIEPFVWTTG